MSLRAEHINPIYKIVIESIPALCDSQSSNVRLSERSKLVTKSGLVLQISNGKWQTDDDKLNDKLNDIQKTKKDLVQQMVKVKTKEPTHTSRLFWFLWDILYIS